MLVSSILVAGLIVTAGSALNDDEFPDSDPLLRALVDELGRSMELKLEDLESPYFVQYRVEDSRSYSLQATYGALVGDSESRSRRLNCSVRVGSLELDNTNFQSRRSGSGRAELPIEDVYVSLRKAIWLATDRTYKDAVETLTQKRAYMKDKEFDDRPADFTEVAAETNIEPRAEIEDPREVWRERLRRLSKRFETFEHIQDSDVTLAVGGSTSYLVNSDGTRLRLADTGARLAITAEVQCEDGEIISDGVSYLGEGIPDLPSEEKIAADIDRLVEKLAASMNAPVLENYTGPVLFDGIASAQVFKALLAEGIAGRPEPVGTARRRSFGSQDLENRLGKRVLPSSFKVFDDPRVVKIDKTFLAGHYQYDDEGVKAQRVDVVEEGILEKMLLGRAPTKKSTGSNGHGRGSGTTQAMIGCLFIESDEGQSPEELKGALIEAARDQDLEYAIRVTSLKGSGLGGVRDILSLLFRFQRGRTLGLPDPLHVYKVYVEDGREERVRRCEFGQVTVRALRDIIAAGSAVTVFNDPGISLRGQIPASSIIAPGVIFEELDLSKIEQELDKPPILKAPHVRE